MTDFARSTALLLNPFLVIIYLTDVVQKLRRQQFHRVLLRAGLMAGAVFCVFAIVGDAVFGDFMQVEFASSDLWRHLRLAVPVSLAAAGLCQG